MIGSAFAINKQFFWDIGAYDHDLKVWQGEQLEMSFKGEFLILKRYEPLLKLPLF